MLSKEYLDTARTILRAAQTMTDQHVAGQLKALAEETGKGIVNVPVAGISVDEAQVPRRGLMPRQGQARSPDFGPKVWVQIWVLSNKLQADVTRRPRELTETQKARFPGLLVDFPCRAGLSQIFEFASKPVW